MSLFMIDTAEPVDKWGYVNEHDNIVFVNMNSRRNSTNILLDLDDGGEYSEVSKEDVPKLIKALQAAVRQWEGE